MSIDTEVSYPNSPEGPNTTLASGPFGDQLTWLKQDLIQANANRLKVPWIVVSGHRPFYSAGTGVWAPSRSVFEPLFIQYSVDLVFWGETNSRPAAFRTPHNCVGR